MFMTSCHVYFFILTPTFHDKLSKMLPNLANRKQKLNLLANSLICQLFAYTVIFTIFFYYYNYNVPIL